MLELIVQNFVEVEIGEKRNLDRFFARPRKVPRKKSQEEKKMRKLEQRYRKRESTKKQRTMRTGRQGLKVVLFIRPPLPNRYSGFRRLGKPNLRLLSFVRPLHDKRRKKENAELQ